MPVILTRGYEYCAVTGGRSSRPPPWPSVPPTGCMPASPLPAVASPRRATTRHRPTASRSPSRLPPDHLSDQETCHALSSRPYRRCRRMGEDLPPDIQARIGAGRHRAYCAQVGLDATADDVRGSVTPRPCLRGRGRALQRPAARAVSEAVPAIDPDRPLLPASLGEVCAQCGRHHDERYGEGCPWISPGDGTDADGPAAPGIPWMV